MSDKVRENRVRRMAARQGLRLVKSRRRDPNAVDFGQYWLTDPDTGGLVFGDQWGAELDDVEAWLAGGRGVGGKRAARRKAGGAR